MASGLWEAFRRSALWRGLKRSAILRSGLYLCIELRRTLVEDRLCRAATVNRDFERARDPWHYESRPPELEKSRRQEALLPGVATQFARGLEIGCAEGRFTETMAGLCSELLVSDIAPLALERTRARREWGPAVEFRRFDLRPDPLPGQFDLIVAGGILEYFPRRATLRKVRAKLVGALASGGLLLVTTKRVPEVVESSWWSELLPRGRRVNELIAADSHLELVAEDVCDQFCISLFRKWR